MEAMVRRYQAVWNTSYGKALLCQESGNPHNPFAVTIVRSGVPRSKENLKVAVPRAACLFSFPNLNMLGLRTRSPHSRSQGSEFCWVKFSQTEFNPRIPRTLYPSRNFRYMVVHVSMLIMAGLPWTVNLNGNLCLQCCEHT